ncbi:LapA family protein [Paeniglutamicibacter sp. Y32M11]|uniref:LapA family protein n=1 Tax=Paeniglutamicibacter sp. Y32M11 TaxID=2853258 RepID=UPI001C5281FA|nr:LapA family protein [Paeniglutamicibacter sp. Y32M11]QXQ09000.1 LapA family protein [Paeniglutamicibacter sp. Y32M11]
MIQNQDHVTVYFPSFHGQLALDITLPIAALAGSLVVSIVGAVRIIQWRARAHSASKSLAKNVKRARRTSWWHRRRTTTSTVN